MISVGVLASKSLAQGPGPLPPPPPPPLGNPINAAKTQLGALLFWDEQLSSTRTVSCATCHSPEAGGSDAHSNPALAGNVNPGLDQLFGSPDDIHGSPGVVRNFADGSFDASASFGLGRQVTGRKAPSAINAVYGPSLFWDGRATGTFRDPVTNAIVLNQGAALESQAVGPIVNDGEMGHVGRNWTDVVLRVNAMRPLAVSPSVPAGLTAFINGRMYPAIFQEAFGSPGVDAARIGMAIATYERSLFSNQAPVDAFFGGNPGALTALEQQGLQLFGSPVTSCSVCHPAPFFSNQTFRYIGVRPNTEDPGRFGVTANPQDMGRMRVPMLRNLELRAPYFHNGSMATIEDVIEFYNRGGDFNAPNKDPLIRPLNLTQGQKNALAAFLKRPMTDPRVAAAQGPFEHPALFSDSANVPQLFGTPTAGTGGFAPHIVALSPPMVGNAQFTVGIEHGNAGKTAGLLVDVASQAGTPWGDAISYMSMSPALQIFRSGQLNGVGAGHGWDSFVLPIANDPLLVGTELYGQYFVFDPAPGRRFAATEAFGVTIF